MAWQFLNIIDVQPDGKRFVARLAYRNDDPPEDRTEMVQFMEEPTDQQIDAEAARVLEMLSAPAEPTEVEQLQQRVEDLQKNADDVAAILADDSKTEKEKLAAIEEKIGKADAIEAGEVIP